MSDLGSQLRLAREAKGLSLEQVFKATRIKATYLEALESNRMDALPGLAQARGFVRSYANYLGLNGEVLASVLDTGHAAIVSASAEPAKPTPAAKDAVRTVGQPNKPIDAQSAAAGSIAPTSTPATLRADRAHVPLQSVSKLRAPSPTSPSPLKSRSASTGGLPTPLLIVGAVVLFGVGLLLILTALSGPKAPAPAPSASSENKLVVSSIAPIVSGPLSLTLVANEHVWLRVTLDGQTAFEGLLDSKASQIWTANDQVIVETGNAAAVMVTFNGQTAPLGNRGQVVARAWSHSGVESVPVAAPDRASELPAQPTSVATTTIKP